MLAHWTGQGARRGMKGTILPTAALLTQAAAATVLYYTGLGCYSWKTGSPWELLLMPCLPLSPSRHSAVPPIAKPPLMGWT